MLYFSSEVKMQGQKKSGGPKEKWGPNNFFRRKLGPLTFSLLPTPIL